MQKSDSIANLAAALVNAQPLVKTAIMDSTNPFFKSKYADLGSVWDAVRNALQASGLAVSQLPDSINGEPALTTMLIHISGDWIAATYPLVVPNKDETAQGYGSAVTYARRYGLSALMGVIADTDDDGNAASKRPTPSQTKVITPPNLQGAITMPPAKLQSEATGSEENSEDPDGQVTNWVEKETAIIKAAKSLPELTAWLDKVASDKDGVAGDLANPASGSTLRRLQSKSPSLFAVIKAQYMQRLAAL